MALMLVDLDNTLIDRDGAFQAAAAAFPAEYGLPATDLAWIMALDATGYTARDVVGAAMADRYADAVPGAAIRPRSAAGGEYPQHAGSSERVVSNNRTWSQDAYEPTEISSDVASAIQRILETAHSQRRG